MNSGVVWSCLPGILAGFAGVPAQGHGTVLYYFQNGSDGARPTGSVIADAAGNLYGTTDEGGKTGATCAGGSCGTVFQLAPDGTETVLYAFTGGTDGNNPVGALLADTAGNLYGTTSPRGPGDYGTIFQVGPGGTETTLYTFAGGSDGSGPTGLMADKAGDLFGTTGYGGNMKIKQCEKNGCGTVFELKPNGQKTTLYAFKAGNDGWVAEGRVIADKAGNLYGTTMQGGGHTDCSVNYEGCGTVFKLTPDGTETVLYAFTGGSDGAYPESGVIMDEAGNLYGTTESGGTGCDGSGCGTVFKVAPDGTETVLYAFQGSTDGANPLGGLIADKAGNFHGTTNSGGTGCRNQGCGTVFRLAPDGTKTILETMKEKTGEGPAAALLLGKHGTLYGTASFGGDNDNGVVFSVKN